MHWSAAVLLTVSIGGGWAASASQQTPSQATGLILGRVIDAQTDSPLAGLMVVLSGGPRRAQGAPMTREPRVLTDGEGRFVFRGVAPGTYRIATIVGGNGFSPNGFIVTGRGFPIGAYLDGGFGQQRPSGPLQPIEFTEGQHIGDAVIRLWKAAAITGRVLDEVGEPLVGQVVGVASVGADGHLGNGPTIRTDDRGAYRFGTLAPGRYIIFVPQTHVSMPVSIGEALVGGPPDPLAANRFSQANAPSPRLGGLRVGGSLVATTPDSGRYGSGTAISNALPPIRDGDTILAYRTTFFASAESVGQATRIALVAGEERSGVDVQLRLVPSTAISGYVVDDHGPVPHLGLHLMPGDMADETSILEAATTATDGRGAFTFPVVPSGQYTIIAWRIGGIPTGDRQRPFADPARLAEQPGAWAMRAMTVGDRPIENVTLTLRSPIVVSGRVAFRGSSERPPAERLRAGFPVTIARASTLFRAPARAPGSSIDPDAGGRFSVRGVSPPGRFVVGAPNLPPPWSLESVTLDGRDITDAVFVLEEVDVTDLLISYTDSPASLTGSVQLGAGASDMGASVLLFPANRTRWAEPHRGARTFRITRASTAGTFMFSDLPPGEYLIAAVRDDQSGDWPDGAFLTRLASVATPVRVAVGQASTVTLNVSPLR